MSSHLARIVKIDSIAPIIGADKIQTAYVLGAQVVVGKEVKVGDIGVFFDGEIQLSEDFCSQNNLFRDSTQNKDINKKGFFEPNRRVRVQKFLKVRSEGFFVELESLAYTKTNISKLNVGDSFDEINGVKICQKYVSEKTKRLIEQNKNRKIKIKVVEAPLFKEHSDTENINYYIDTIPKGSLITINSKWHGTSGRVSYTKTCRELPWLKKLVNRIYSIFSNEKWEYLAGSRRVVLFPEHQEKVGYHGPDKWRFDILEELKPHLSKNMTIYFEIVGFVNGSSVMPSHEVSKLKDPAYTKKYGDKIVYKYGCLSDQYKYKIYRISIISDSGEIIDFTDAQMTHWCEIRGLLCCKPLVPSFVYDGDRDKLLELVKTLGERTDRLSEDYDDPSHILEGVVVRCDYKFLVPIFYKYKSFAFKVLEGIAKEQEVDIEDAS